MLGHALLRALETFPLADWARDQGFELVSRHEWATTCPRCSKPLKLTLNVERRLWKCWVCQRKALRIVGGVQREVTVEGGGGLLRLFAWFYAISVSQAAQWVLSVCPQATPALGSLRDLELAAVAVEAADTAEELTPPDPPAEACQLDAQGLAYLESRGITEPMARAYGLFSCRGGRLNGRVVFPAWRRGSLRYWQARATWPAALDEAQGRKHVKVLNPPRLDHDPRLTSEHSVFNVERAAALGQGTVVLCEGPISAVRAGDDAVALWGKRLYSAQLAEMVRVGVQNVVVMFDGPTSREPEGAWPEALRLAPTLALFFDSVRLVRLPQGDPGDYTREQNLSFRAAAIESARVSTVGRI